MDESQKNKVVSDFESLGASNIDTYQNVNSIGADIPVRKIRKLASLRHVNSIVGADKKIFKTTS
ncbi:MAG: hypothetical protein DRN66_00805 [Candidatus Nanohalarchaeota archaeon]|nr:MAG: hypothetical protein DRN66_00805 [Candidatus Nanohaloarchaeota archaeon]